MHAYSGTLLLARSALLTSVIISLAAGSHVIGGGRLPDGGILAALAALALVPVTVLARRRIGLRPTLLTLGLGQLALHLAFAALAPTDPCGASTAETHAGHPGHSAVLAQHCVRASHLALGVSLADATMTLAHAAAVLLTALVVAGGDRALALLLTWLRPLIDAFAPRPTSPVTGAPLRTAFDVACPVPPRPAGRVCSRRGPPVGRVASA